MLLLRSYSIRSLAFLACVACLPAPGCARGSNVAALEARVDSLEERNARVAKVEQRLAAMESIIAGLQTNIRDTQSTILELLQTLEQTTTQLDLLTRRSIENKRTRPTPRAPGPDPLTVYAVPVAGSPFIGPKNAKVTLVKVFEFACPYCERSRSTMDQLRKRYGKDLRIVYKHFIVHPQTATLPARAACAAHLQKRFSQMENALWDKAYHRSRDFSKANIMKIASSLKLNMKRFRKHLNGKCTKRVIDDQALMSGLGTRGTPAFYINGRFLSGARPAHMFEQIIDQELAKANRTIRAGTVRQADYYDHVVANGKTSL